MRKYDVTVNNHNYKIEVKDFSSDKAELEVDGKPFTVEVKDIQKSGSPAVKKKAFNGEKKKVVKEQVTPSVSGKTGTVSAPIPGIIIKILVSPGDEVEAGQTLLKMEAMKMENEIKAPKAGRIASIAVKEGDSVAHGQDLFIIG
ncbi:biotin/lipoyl-containing protein [Candidatus Riflebacteria bacterium]